MENNWNKDNWKTTTILKFPCFIFPFSYLYSIIFHNFFKLLTFLKVLQKKSTCCLSSCCISCDVMLSFRFRRCLDVPFQDLIPFLFYTIKLTIYTIKWKRKLESFHIGYLFTAYWGLFLANPRFQEIHKDVMSISRD